MQGTPQITPASWALIGAVGLIWGATFLVTALALEGISPFWLAAARIAFAALLTLIVWRLRGGRLFVSGQCDYPSLFAIGAISSALPFTLLSWGQQHVTSGFAGVSMAAVALIILPLAHVFIPGEHMGPRRVGGMAIGFLGVLVLMGSEAFASSGAALEPWGRAACLGAACCYAVGSVLMRRLPPIDPVGLAAVPLSIGAMYIVPVAWVVEGPPPLPDTQTLLLLAFLGLVPTAGANLMRIIVVRSAGPVFMSLVSYQVPMWSVLLGVVILGEPWQASLAWALALILAGLALSQWTALKALFAAVRRA